MSDNDTNWALCQWANLSFDGDTEAIDLDDYTLFTEALLGAAGGPK